MLKTKIIESLNEFQTITLSQMDEVKLMNRVDTKYAFSIEVLLDVLSIIKDDYRVLEIENTKIPSYESLYFDDEQFSFYNDHHRNKVHRFKVRIRNYIESNLFFLEVKEKIKGRTNKKRIKTNEFCLDLNEKQQNFIDKMMEEHPELKPVLYNSFHRITLVNNKDKERLTLDFDLKFKWNQKEVGFEKLVIAELKQEETNKTSPFYVMMKRKMIRPYRLSKYCIGMIEIYGSPYVRYNRFKKKLLQLKKISYAA